MSAEVARIEEVADRAIAAIDAIDRVDTVEDADVLLRQITAYQAAVKLARIGAEHEREWATVRFRAERKMGELLGAAENHGPATVNASHGSTDAERQQRRLARKLAAVPEDTFAKYLETAEEPTRAGLLREAAKSKTPESSPAEPEYTYCPACGHRVRADKPLRPRGGRT